MKFFYRLVAQLGWWISPPAKSKHQFGLRYKVGGWLINWSAWR